MTRFEPGRAADLEQKLAAKLGELLAFAARFDQGALVDATHMMTRALVDLRMTRVSMADAISILALTIVRGPTGPFAVADVPGHPDNLPDRRNTETVDGYAARLVEHLQRDTGGTFAESDRAQAIVYARAVGGVQAIIATSAGTEDTIAQISKILAAVEKIEDQADRQPPETP